MAELLIVISIIGIIAAISIPIYLEQKDRTIIGVTKANLEAMRSGLTQFTIRSSDNRYPVFKLNYFDFRAAVPESNLPPLETDAKIVSSSFFYSSDGITYTLHATSTNQTAERFAGTPSGIIQE